MLKLENEFENFDVNVYKLLGSLKYHLISHNEIRKEINDFMNSFNFKHYNETRLCEMCTLFYRLQEESNIITAINTVSSYIYSLDLYIYMDLDSHLYNAISYKGKKYKLEEIDEFQFVEVPF